jgi:hypothetical protein
VCIRGYETAKKVYIDAKKVYNVAKKFAFFAKIICDFFASFIKN